MRSVQGFASPEVGVIRWLALALNRYRSIRKRQPYRSEIGDVELTGKCRDRIIADAGLSKVKLRAELDPAVG